MSISQLSYPLYHMVNPYTPISMPFSSTLSSSTTADRLVATSMTIDTMTGEGYRLMLKEIKVLEASTVQT